MFLEDVREDDQNAAEERRRELTGDLQEAFDEGLDPFASFVAHHGLDEKGGRMRNFNYDYV